MRRTRAASVGGLRYETPRSTSTPVKPRSNAAAHPPATQKQKKRKKVKEKAQTTTRPPPPPPESVGPIRPSVIERLRLIASDARGGFDDVYTARAAPFANLAREGAAEERIVNPDVIARLRSHPDLDTTRSSSRSRRRSSLSPEQPHHRGSPQHHPRKQTPLEREHDARRRRSAHQLLYMPTNAANKAAFALQIPLRRVPVKESTVNTLMLAQQRRDMVQECTLIDAEVAAAMPSLAAGNKLAAEEAFCAAKLCMFEHKRMLAEMEQMEARAAAAPLELHGEIAALASKLSATRREIVAAKLLDPARMDGLLQVLPNAGERWLSDGDAGNPDGGGSVDSGGGGGGPGTGSGTGACSLDERTLAGLIDGCTMLPIRTQASSFSNSEILSVAENERTCRRTGIETIPAN